MQEEINPFIPVDWENLLKEYVNTIKIKNNEYDKRAFFKSTIMEGVLKIPPKYIDFEKNRNDLFYKGIIIETKNELNDTKRLEGLKELKKYIEEKNIKKEIISKAILTDFLKFEIYDPKEILEKQIENIKPVDSFRVDYGELEGKVDYEKVFNNLFKMFVLIGKRPPDPIYLIPEINELINKSLILISDISPGIKFEAWKKYVSKALGNENETTLEMYKKHAILYYISVILVARTLDHDDRIDIILKGDPFISDGIMNFIEPDNFFDFLPQDHKVFKLIENTLNQFDFTQKIGKDIFRVLYEDLISPSERHSLGEFYTPEWLAKILVDDVITEKNKIVLDPACGSGTFLREVILKKYELGETLDEIVSEVIGFDINPIAVAIAKATYLLTISEIDKKFKPNIIPVFLADSLMPLGNVKFIKGKKLGDVRILKDKEVLENAITINFGEILPGEGSLTFNYEPNWSIKQMTEYLAEISQIHKDKLHLNDDLINKIEKLAEQNKNHIWYYILRNIYTPYYFTKKIDIVLGNPPWLTFKDVKSPDRQDFLNLLYKGYKLSSGSEYKTQKDMAEFFIVRSQEYLKNRENGIIAFILTRAILNGGQYNTLRIGECDFKLFIEKIWDLDDNANPFRKPACMVKFSNKKSLKNIPGFLIKSDINVKKIIDVDKEKISLQPIKFYLNITEDYSGIISQDTQNNSQAKNIKNNYKKSFKNGATIFPRPYFFIEIIEERTKAFKIKTEDIYMNSINKKRKKGNYNFYFHDEYVPKELVYETILGENIGKFRLINTKEVVLPIVNGKFIFDITIKNNSYRFYLKSEFSEEPLYKSYEEYFNKIEEDWEKGRGGKFGVEKDKASSKMSIWHNLNYNNKLLKQFENRNDKKDKKLVVYNSNGKIIRSAVIDNLNYVIDHNSYYGLFNENEAFYLTGILNSNYFCYLLKKTGILSERHIHKKPFDLPFPNFDPEKELHVNISELSRKLHQIAQQNIEIEKSKEFSELNEAVKKLFE